MWLNWCDGIYWCDGIDVNRHINSSIPSHCMMNDFTLKLFQSLCVYSFYNRNPDPWSMVSHDRSFQCLGNRGLGDHRNVDSTRNLLRFWLSASQSPWHIFNGNALSGEPSFPTVMRMNICVGPGSWVGEGTGADEVCLLEGKSVEDTVGTKVVAFLVGTHVLGAFVDGDGVGVLVQGFGV
jgi:hypothetical protein